MKKHSDEFVREFCEAWNKSESIDIAAQKLGLTRERTRRLSCTIKRRGCKLKKYPTIPIQNAKRIRDPTLEEIKVRAEEIRKTW